VSVLALFLSNDYGILLVIWPFFILFPIRLLHDTYGVVKNKTVYTYGDGDGIVIIVVSIYHLLYEYLDCSVKLTEEYVLQFQGASILSATSTSQEVHVVRFSAACCTWVFTEFRQTKFTTAV